MRLRLPAARVTAPYLLIAAGLLGLAGWWIAGRVGPTPEQQIRRALLQVAAGVERHSLRDIMGGLAADYHDARGNTREDLWRQAVRYVGSRDRVRVEVSDVQAEAQGPVGVATCRVTVRGRGPFGEAVGFTGVVSFHLRRTGLLGRWRITSSDGWQATAEPYRE